MVYWIIAVVAVVIILIFYYNKIVTLREAVVSSETEISVQLDRRGKVFDSLLETVKKYLSHEDNLFTKITALRTKAQTGSPDEIRQAEDELSKIVSNGDINVAVEAYPDLKSDRVMMNLQEEIISSENKLAFSKRGYNRSLEVYNAYIASIPPAFIVAIFSGLKIDKSYWRLEETAIKTEESRRISFD